MFSDMKFTACAPWVGLKGSAAKREKMYPQALQLCSVWFFFFFLMGSETPCNETSKSKNLCGLWSNLCQFRNPTLRTTGLKKSPLETRTNLQRLKLNQMVRKTTFKKCCKAKAKAIGFSLVSSGLNFFCNSTASADTVNSTRTPNPNILHLSYNQESYCTSWNAPVLINDSMKWPQISTKFFITVYCMLGVYCEEALWGMWSLTEYGCQTIPPAS